MEKVLFEEEVAVVADVVDVVVNDVVTVGEDDDVELELTVEGQFETKAGEEEDVGDD